MWLVSEGISSVNVIASGKYLHLMSLQWMFDFKRSFFIYNVCDLIRYRIYCSKSSLLNDMPLHVQWYSSTVYNLFEFVVIWRICFNDSVIPFLNKISNIVLKWNNWLLSFVAYRNCSNKIFKKVSFEVFYDFICHQLSKTHKNCHLELKVRTSCN